MSTVTRLRPPADLLEEPDRLLTMEEWGGLIGLSAARARGIVAAGGVPGAKWQGRRWMVPLRAHREYVANLPDGPDE